MTDIWNALVNAAGGSWLGAIGIIFVAGFIIFLLISHFSKGNKGGGNGGGGNNNSAPPPPPSN